jgi:hypothetical protein
MTLKALKENFNVFRIRWYFILEVGSHKMRLKPFVFIVSSFLSSSLSMNALAISLGGGISGSYEIFKGIIEPFDITIDGQTINTGLVNFTLDSSESSNFIFDFNNMTHAYESSLFITAPGLDLLGAPPQRITVSLTGAITSTVPDDVIPGSEFDLTIFSETLTGGGVFESGQLLSGWRYNNIQINTTNVTNVNVQIGNDNKAETKCDTSSKAEGSGRVDANLTDPTGKQVIPLTGQGQTSSGNNKLSCPPPKTLEPTSTLSLLSLGILGAGATLKRKVKRSHSTEKEPSNVG